MNQTLRFFQDDLGGARLIQRQVQPRDAQLVFPIDDPTRSIEFFRLAKVLEGFTVLPLSQLDAAVLAERLWMSGILRIRVVDVLLGAGQPISLRTLRRLRPLGSKSQLQTSFGGQ